MSKRIVSGIQPTGSLHLGNYLGAIRNWVALQEEAECIFFLADLHALTQWNDPAALRQSVYDVAAALIAAGIDPERSVLFRQSAVSAHAELAWLLGCTARVGWLNRMTQFKDKSGRDREGASAGLYFYPVLQAADILAYKATHVPVGEDQKQHLELARDIAIKFNADYGTEHFVPPEPFIGGTAARVMSLRDGRAKMSKSDPSDQSRINLTDDADAIAIKVKRARTDPELLPGDPAMLAGRPEAANLVAIYAALAGESEAGVLARFEGKGFGAFKPALAELMVERLAPMNERFRHLREDAAELERLLSQGGERARAIAGPILRDTYEVVGLA